MSKCKRQRNEETPKERLITIEEGAYVSTLNLPEIRGFLMEELLEGTPVKWLGSWLLYRTSDQAREANRLSPEVEGFKRIESAITWDQLSEVLEPLTTTKVPLAFTVGVARQQYFAHYNSFVFIPRSRGNPPMLIWFDPGVGVHAGDSAIAEGVAQAIQRDLGVEDLEEKNCSVVKPCMQCNEDAFCQTWTLLFIYNFARVGSCSFVEEWKQIPPPQRLELIRSFVLSIVYTFRDVHALMWGAIPEEIEFYAKAYGRPSPQEQRRLTITEPYTLLSQLYSLQGQSLLS